MIDKFLERVLEKKTPMFGGVVLLKDHTTLLQPEEGKKGVVRCTVRHFKPNTDLDFKEMGTCFIDTSEDLPGWQAE